MVTPAGQNASVVLTFTTRDNASPGIQRIGANLTRLQSTAAGVGKVFTQNATAFIGAGLALATAGTQVAQLGVKFGLLDEKQGEILGTSLQVAGVFFTMSGAIAQVIATLGGMGISIGVLAASLGGLITLLIAAAAAIVVLELSARKIEDRFGIDVSRGGGPFADIIQGRVPGAGQPTGQESFLGKTISQVTAPNAAGGSVILNVGTLIADEFGLRELQRRLRGLSGEEKRTRGVTQ